MKLALLALLVAGRTAAADARGRIDGEDVTEMRGTVDALGTHHTIEEHRDVHWTAKAGAVTLGKVVDTKLQDGQPSDDVFDRSERLDGIARGLALDATVARVIAGTTFAPDVPVAFTDDQLRALSDPKHDVTARRLVVTWAGTAGGLAHYRVFAVFDVGSMLVSGSAVIAGTIDLDVGRAAIVDVRVSAILTTGGLARFAVAGGAHLTRR
jgi:hypothetical protein